MKTRAAVALDKAKPLQVMEVDLDGPKAGESVKTTLFPITMDGQRLNVRLHPPRLGEHTDELLGSLGCSPDEIGQLRKSQTVA